MIANQTSWLTKVLIVDDSALIASRLKKQISALPGIEISGIAGDIPAALQVVETHSPDVIILLGMIRKTHPHVQVIMLTNLSGQEYQDKCLQLGANFFLDKTSEFEKIPELLLQIHQMKDTPWPWTKELR